jgi:hypothetical protein
MRALSIKNCKDTLDHRAIMSVSIILQIDKVTLRQARGNTAPVTDEAMLTTIMYHLDPR